MNRISQFTTPSTFLKNYCLYKVMPRVDSEDLDMEKLETIIPGRGTVKKIRNVQK